MLGGGTVATRITLAVLAISAEVVGATGTATDCCSAQDGDACCPKPPILDMADDYGKSSSERVVFDSERCCPDGSGVVGCSAYGTTGCSFCRDECDEADASCVLCSVATSTTAHVVSPASSGYLTGEWSPPYDPETADDLWGVFGYGSEGWSSDIEAMMSPGSYDFIEESGEYDCSSCAWGGMSALKQRKLTERSRSMVCDSTCLQGEGHDDYGVTLCNYFNEGKECRACCHEGHMVEGCMPCEGQGSCNTCETKIKDLCREDPCSEECQAYVCCAVSWSEYSGCVESMSAAVAELMDFVSTQCSVDFTCDMTDPTCSDNARTCTASVGDSRRLQEVAQATCAVISVGGAGSFDADYASSGPLSSELVFKAIGARHAAYSLRSVSIDVCTGSDVLPYLDAANMDILVARSTTGRLAWNDGTELRPYDLNTGVGCARHVWVLQDTAGSHSHAFFTVDPSEHPRYITSDWVKVRLGGDMTKSDLVLSCTAQENQVEWF